MKVLSLSSLIVPIVYSTAILPITVSAKGGGGHGSGHGSSTSTSHSGSSSSGKGSSSSQDSTVKSGSGSGSSGSSSYRGSGSSIIIIHDSHNPSICYNQAAMDQVPCPKQSPNAAMIAGIVIGSVVGALLLGILIWYLYRKWLPKYRARRANKGVLPTSAPPDVSGSEKHYQPLEGHQFPEGVARDDVASFSETSTFVGHEDGSGKKEWSLPDPEKGYLQPHERG